MFGVHDSSVLLWAASTSPALLWSLPVELWVNQTRKENSSVASLNSGRQSDTLHVWALNITCRATIPKCRGEYTHGDITETEINLKNKSVNSTSHFTAQRSRGIARLSPTPESIQAPVVLPMLLSGQQKPSRSSSVAGQYCKTHFSKKVTRYRRNKGWIFNEWMPKQSGDVWTFTFMNLIYLTQIIYREPQATNPTTPWMRKLNIPGSPPTQDIWVVCLRWAVRIPFLPRGKTFGSAHTRAVVCQPQECTATHHFIVQRAASVHVLGSLLTLDFIPRAAP